MTISVDVMVMPAARILSTATETLWGEREPIASLTTWTLNLGWPDMAVWATQMWASIPAMMSAFLPVFATRTENSSVRKQSKVVFGITAVEIFPAISAIVSRRAFPAPLLSREGS